MLEIHEKKDTVGYEEIVGNIDCKYLHIVESINGQEINGYGIYSVDENGITIYDFNSSDMNITDGIIRTILFKAMLSGINECKFEINNENKLHVMVSLGFIKENVKYISDISDFMVNCKKCKELQ